jgi:hypothetical protein
MIDTEEIRLAIKDLVVNYYDGEYRAIGELDEEIKKIINLVKEDI